MKMNLKICKEILNILNILTLTVFIIIPQIYQEINWTEKLVQKNHNTIYLFKARKKKILKSKNYKIKF
jgi:hypothetical protein